MRKAMLLVAGVLTIGTAWSEMLNPPVDMVVKVPVANVRAKPVAHKGKYKYDELQQTQVVQGERVRVYEKQGKWLRVECLEQEEFTQNSRWQGYPGWIEASALTTDMSLATTPPKLDVPLDTLRAKILEAASQHLGEPYLWGGCSLHDKKNKKIVTGVDCSGLVHWSFRQVGWVIPRDAHEIFIRSHSVRTFRLKPADFIFLAKTENPHKIVHVMFYAGNEELIEAPQSGEKVRKISFQERFGKALSASRGGDVVGDRIIYFGSIFEEGQ